MTNVHRIEGTDRLLMQTIQDQAADIEHGVREGVQNGVDSPGATRVDARFGPERTRIWDDGDGVDLSTEEGLALLKNLGETTKADDPDTIGQFGIGKGQIVAKGHAVFMSGDRAIHFDIKEWGLTVKTVPLAQPVSGLEVRVHHYEDEVPYSGSYKWDRYEERIAKRFKYVEEATGVEVWLNGERISDGDPYMAVGSEHAFVGSDDIGVDYVAALQPSADGGVSVYSRGVYVKDMDGHGVEGDVVVRENLDLNFARNDIKSGCPKWRAVSEWLDDKTADILSGLPDDRLTSAARAFLAERSMSGGHDLDPEAPIFRTVDGRNLSLNDISSVNQMAFGSGADQRARKLATGWNMTILDTTDSAVAQLRTAFEESEALQNSMPSQFDVEQKAEQVSLPDSHEEADERDLNTVQRRKLAAARELADRMGVDREIRWGKSQVDDAWTDGSSHITLTDGAAPERSRAAWLPNVFRTIVAQWASRDDTEGGLDSDGIGYRRRYHRRMEENWSVFAGMAEEADREGLASVLRTNHAALTA